MLHYIATPLGLAQYIENRFPTDTTRILDLKLCQTGNRTRDKLYSSMQAILAVSPRTSNNKILNGYIVIKADGFVRGYVIIFLY
jgi:hypothetical protein